MALVGDGGVFGGQAEGVPTHGVQHVEAAHPLVAGQGVADGVIADMADVQRAAGIGQHLQHVVFRARGILFGFVKGGVLPAGVPFQLDLVVVVRLFGHSLFKFSRLRRSLGCARMRRNPALPMYPSPMFACRSVCAPSGVEEAGANEVQFGGFWEAVIGRRLLVADAAVTVMAGPETEDVRGLAGQDRLRASRTASASPCEPVRVSETSGG